MLPVLRGVIASIVMVVNTLFWATPLYVCIPIKLLVPKGPARDAVSRAMAWLSQRWALCNIWFAKHLLSVHWDVRLNANVDVRPDGQYLVCANHQTWNDILTVVAAFGDRAPFFKFFLKQELIWVPVLGLAWWGLDYPFMKRHTPSQIKKNPALKGTDIETTKRACERFRNQPGMVLNFLEGTRFTPAKHERQKSPYTHLLRPKAGGLAFALSALGERINSLVDVTIVYPQGPQGFWAFLSGRVNIIIVEVRQLTIPHEFFVHAYESDPEAKRRFQAWLSELWREKDQRITELLAESRKR